MDMLGFGDVIFSVKRTPEGRKYTLSTVGVSTYELRYLTCICSFNPKKITIRQVLLSSFTDESTEEIKYISNTQPINEGICL